MGICLCISIILELCFKHDNVSLGKCFVARLLCLLCLICVSFNDCIEKYLVNTNFMSPFKILMIEGIFEFIMAILLSIRRAPFKDIKKKYEEKNTGRFALLIFLLLLYLILSAVLNSYKIYCNVIYSPMAKSLMDYLLSPFLCIYYFIKDGDFKKNYFFFFMSEFICIVTVFFGCVFNEYIILVCCGLEHNTTEEIIGRASSVENIPTNIALYDVDGDEEEDCDINDYRISFKNSKD